MIVARVDIVSSETTCWMMVKSAPRSAVTCGCSMVLTSSSSITAASDVVAKILTGNSASVSSCTMLCTAAPAVVASSAMPIFMNSPTTWKT